MVGVDGDPSSDDAIADALRALKTGMVGMLHVVHVIALGELSVIQDARSLPLQSDVCEHALSAARVRVGCMAGTLGVELRADQVSFRVVVGDFVETLLLTGSTCRADLMIVGGRGSAASERTKHAQALSSGAQCPVLIARADGQAQRGSSEEAGISTPRQTHQEWP
ncbi:MAG: universal stress protein [Polyangiales bacterium]